MFIIKKLITPFLLPPGIFIVLCLAFGIRALIKKNRMASYFAFALAAGLWISSIPPVANLFVDRVESDYTFASYEDADVIIMLGGGIYSHSPDFTGKGSPSPASMERMVTAARLQRKLDIPIIISGGKIYESSESSISIIANRFLIDLGVPPEAIIKENRSRDTYENALYCKTICEEKGFIKPILVTSGNHMKRSIISFDKVGLEVIPFPCGAILYKNLNYSWTSYLPSASALETTSSALHEKIGLLYYRIRH